MGSVRCCTTSSRPIKEAKEELAPLKTVLGLAKQRAIRAIIATYDIFGALEVNYLGEGR